MPGNMARSNQLHEGKTVPRQPGTGKMRKALLYLTSMYGTFQKAKNSNREAAKSLEVKVEETIRVMRDAEIMRAVSVVDTDHVTKDELNFY